MILSIGVGVGLLAAALRLKWGGGRLDLPTWRSIWLVPLAFLPQWMAFKSPSMTRFVINSLHSVLGFDTLLTQPADAVDIFTNPSQEISLVIYGAILVVSQALMLVFTWINRDKAGFWLLGLGTGLNLLVIALNGGWMPISPESVAQIAPGAAEGTWQIGARLGSSKDLVLLPEQMRLGFLSDRLLIPAWIPYRAAFSLGDVFIALGAFWAMWSLGSGRRNVYRTIQGVAYESG